MMKFVLGKKVTMTQVFDHGRMIPVTLVETKPCEVLQVKTKEKDGYCAIQIGFDKITKEKRIKKTMKGKEYRYLKEIRVSESDLKNYKVGDSFASDFIEGDKIKVAGISKGKGFSGAVKKWGFKGRLSSTHGTKHELRTIGSTGQSGPGRLFKGRKMAGRMGSERATVKNLRIIKIDKDNNLMAINGAIPGIRGTLIELDSR
ncbi:MAG: 50S ribosomal protein L3 [Parcubacteria group bacterium CG_4_10_14_0_2_um_filter_7_35_8]|nr:MAG: 50S ribosomal protein L3 [Parcubacteria group bacterium CG23_combo_of_CG06-09_8_20_14_all_35_6]PIR58543.1 MAG: 50S ribosomal protein L3 [Parcubacteria group bacterium CG10_big_fil_rev_8_21_14_0_10_35_15]PIZ76459.1 MAG: 50S ribosomal protein L3 [Parcubacteria group bacterium CG_4_10_14_0_2_um_filter_7_35_8]